VLDQGRSSCETERAHSSHESAQRRGQMMSVMAIDRQVTKLCRDHTAQHYFSKNRILLSQSSLSTIPV
jgi:hypothetical protein